MSEEVRTPEEIARNIIAAAPRGLLYHGVSLIQDPIDAGSDALRTAIAQAIRDTYERAAQTIEEWEGFRQYEADACAKAIRALKGDASNG